MAFCHVMMVTETETAETVAEEQTETVTKTVTKAVVNTVAERAETDASTETVANTVTTSRYRYETGCDTFRRDCAYDTSVCCATSSSMARPLKYMYTNIADARISGRDS